MNIYRREITKGQYNDYNTKLKVVVLKRQMKEDII